MKEQRIVAQLEPFCGPDRLTIKPGSAIRVYDAAGKAFGLANVDADGCVTADVDERVEAMLYAASARTVSVGGSAKP